MTYCETVNKIADGVSLFSAVCDVSISSFELNSNSAKISECGFQWKISLNPDSTKPTWKVIFTRKLKKYSYPSITINNNPLNLSPTQRCLLALDLKLTSWTSVLKKIVQS